MASVEMLTEPKAQEIQTGNDWVLYLGDSCEIVKGLPDNSVDLTIYSPPFAGLYIYSDHVEDMGNSASNDEFLRHYGYLVPEIFRVTMPGRLCVVHCKDLPTYFNRDGCAGLWDLPGRLIEEHVGGEVADIDRAMRRIEYRIKEAAELHDMERVARLDGVLDILRDDMDRFPPTCGGWSYHSRVTIWKCPVTERERTNNNGLLHKTILRDRSQCRQGMADYLLVFRKTPEATLLSDKPLASKLGLTRYVGETDPRESDEHPSPYARKANTRQMQSIRIWQRYAEPVWWDIDQTNVLNFKQARDQHDEKHICPLQLDLIERCVQLWSDEDEVILDPFAGIGSTGHVAVMNGRRHVGVELKESYWQHACRYLRQAENERRNRDRKLFD